MFRSSLVLTIIFLAGCSSTITNLSEITPYGKDKITTLDNLRKQIYTDDAYEAIRDVPLIDGPAFCPYVAGVGFWSNLASFVSFNGVGRKLIIPPKYITGKRKVTPYQDIGPELIAHEEMHHLDDMFRDGESDLIDHMLFDSVYYKVRTDIKYAKFNQVMNILTVNDHWFNNFFGVGENSEFIACVAGKIIKEYFASICDEIELKDEEKVPEFIKTVFEKVYKKEILYPSK